MKTRLFVLAGVVLAGSLAPALEAQYQAPRQYLRRLAPNAPASRPAAPPNSALPPGPVVAPPPALPAVPASTNTARARAEQLEAQKRAVEALRKRAEAGSASAQYELGVRYLTGKGVATNLVEACKWFEAAARQGDYWAKKKLAELEAQGLRPAVTEAPARSPTGPGGPEAVPPGTKPADTESTASPPAQDSDTATASPPGTPGKRE
jgi:TPR repeat protein